MSWPEYQRLTTIEKRLGQISRSLEAQVGFETALEGIIQDSVQAVVRKARRK